MPIKKTQIRRSRFNCPIPKAAATLFLIFICLFLRWEGSKRFSNTEVVADILIFRKLTETEQIATNQRNYKCPDWVKTVPSGKYTVAQEPIMINQWFMESELA
jgi:hypothetical protein